MICSYHVSTRNKQKIYNGIDETDRFNVEQSESDTVEHIYVIPFTWNPKPDKTRVVVI